MNNTETKPITDIFFNLLRFSIGTENEFNHSLTAAEWNRLFDIAKKQTLIGILFIGIEKLPENLRPHKELLLQWYVICERIKTENRKHNSTIIKISNKFREDGYDSVILKGQGVARYYPQPLYRTPGDIDIWLYGKKRNIIRYVRKKFPNCRPVYHHVDFPVANDVEVEIHFTPSWMNNYFDNKRLQKFFNDIKEHERKNLVTFGDSEDKTAISSTEFNRVFILVHIYRHLFSEGIGLRQLLDYYYTLQQGFSESDRMITLHTLNELKMLRFTGAVMYVMQTVFGLKREYMLTAPQNEDGEFLLQEIMSAGNFGKYDERYKTIYCENNVKRFFLKLKRNMRFLRMYPSEIIWSPMFKIWHFFWRIFT